MRRPRPALAAFVLVLAPVSGGCRPAPRDASSLSLRTYPMRHHATGYVIVDAQQHELTEDEFARLYEARTHTTELRQLDHPRRQGGIIALVGGGLFTGGSAALTAAAVSTCRAPSANDRSGCAALAGNAVLFGLAGAALLVLGTFFTVRGSADDHDLDRARAQNLVDRYNATPGDGASRESPPAIAPLVGPTGVGFRF